jgi:transcription-repair coupling factor (superfamily II helicase)
MIPLDAITSLLAFQELAEVLQSGETVPNLGLMRAARLPVLAALQSRLKRPLLFITDRTDRALSLLDELSLWAPDSTRLFFPEPTPLFYEDAPWDEVTCRNRLMVLTTLAAYHIPLARGSQFDPKPENAPIIVATTRAVMTRTLPRRDFIKATTILQRGQQVQLDKLARSWLSLGYEPVTIVTAPGQFARRGGILDIWPMAAPRPARLEFFGDEIDTLRDFDPTTQRTIQESERLLVTPAREFILESAEQAASVLTQAKSVPGKSNDQDLEEQDAVKSPTEFHIPLLHADPASVLNYLPTQAIVLIDDQEAFQDMVNEVEEQAVTLHRDALHNGDLSHDFPLPYLTWEEIDGLLTCRQQVTLGPVMVEIDEDSPAVRADDLTPLRAAFIPGPRFGGRIKPFFEHLAQVIGQGDQVIIVSRQVARLQDLWAAQTAPASPVSPSPMFVQGSLAEGWVLTGCVQHCLHLFADGEIFGWQRPQPRHYVRPTAEAPEAAYADLAVGDWVVHVDHGIGTFMGLVQRSIEGIENEYLFVEYANGDQLFVPVYQADRVTPYVGVDSRVPSPNRLGGTEWRSTKARVKEGVEEIAQDLLELYAQRHIVQGYAFGSDIPWQHELEASFPYVETEDQLRVLVEVKRDMESERPMDRLICGDVGYGKTEIALRAAFKAVMNGKQVAMLVPTTVLAQQHYQTFRERLSPFPVEVEMLSRFRTPQEQHNIVKHLAAGSVDIVIGTHRLLSLDVSFKDLGLLIIDEEQRFGVTHKETLKRMRTEVDVLTLTATPIPRTLYMALTDIRDISTINTPPAERLPIVTHVGPYSPRLVRNAILRELERGGQVFFVHNRVQTIEGMRRHLEKLVPEARIAIAHGQMDENALSQRMQEFNAAQIDILLSTSIIESGLDIPNANTLIVDRADTFGLAQLYQLRGRIGRGAQRAYAYFFRHKKILPTLEGRARLETIAEHTHLGAGFSIAMRDLEIRGAGDLLGTRQHGQIAAVGFHLYTRLLAEAVRMLRLEPHRATVPSLPVAVEEQPARQPFAIFQIQSALRSQQSIELPVPISIPADYVPDKSVRLRLYRRIADLTNMAEIEALGEEFADRFGPLPMPVQHLLYQLKIRIMAEKAGILSVNTEDGLIALHFPKLPEGVSQREFPSLGKEIRMGKNTLWLPYNTQLNWQDRLVEVLQALIET